MKLEEIIKTLKKDKDNMLIVYKYKSGEVVIKLYDWLDDLTPIIKKLTYEEFNEVHPYLSVCEEKTPNEGNVTVYQLTEVLDYVDE